MITACRPDSQSPEASSPNPTVQTLRGTASYTPYDSLAMIWAREKAGSMAWVASGSEAGKLLVSKADPARRPDFAFASQGVVAGLAARGEQPVILATVAISTNAVRPVFRNPKPNLVGSRSLFVPRSSIELAFDRLLIREGVRPEQVRVPKVENVSFTTIATLLQKPADAPDAIDFGIMVEPFISTVLDTGGNNYAVGDGGLYELQYSLIVRREDLTAHREHFVTLLRDLTDVSQKLESLPTDEAFYQQAWGRQKDGQPERLQKLITFERGALRLQLQPSRLRGLLHEEISYLVGKYPEELRQPPNIDQLVDETLLLQVDRARVKQ
ncbi:MAG TPA: hypothetical protein VM940_00510 [Chthoniobacterales bacterium]|nr:hypothetical protein [Chthoniobacterales bacterium]